MARQRELCLPLQNLIAAQVESHAQQLRYGSYGPLDFEVQFRSIGIEV